MEFVELFAVLFESVLMDVCYQPAFLTEHRKQSQRQSDLESYVHSAE